MSHIGLWPKRKFFILYFDEQFNEQFSFHFISKIFNKTNILVIIFIDKRVKTQDIPVIIFVIVGKTCSDDRFEYRLIFIFIFI